MKSKCHIYSQVNVKDIVRFCLRSFQNTENMKLESEIVYDISAVEMVGAIRFIKQRINSPDKDK